MFAMFHRGDGAGRGRRDGIQAGRNGSMNLTIRCGDDSLTPRCPVCEQHHGGSKGPRLFFEDRPEPLCRSCGKRLAPSLAALLDLATTAEKVGRLCRHLLTPPMESLLDLARAAEDYSTCDPRSRARVG
jgi:hypothetical protein